MWALFYLTSFAVSSRVRVLLQGSKITPFERPWSTTTMIESYPSTGGVIVTTISHLYFVLFITFVTFAVATLLFVIVYYYMYTI